MSQITILGFTPVPSSSQASDSIHWSVLLSPTVAAESTPLPRPKPKSFFSQRRLPKTNTDAAPETALFDMHNHQLRQQAYPVPVSTKSTSDNSESSDSSDSASSPTDNLRTTSGITSSVPRQTLQPSLRILLGTHHLSVSKLAPKLSTLLYRTPTYGPEEDWLRAALDTLVGSSILEPAASYDTDSVLAFVREAVQEYLTQAEQEGEQEWHEVLELDYASHVTAMEEVKAMFTHHHPAKTTPPYTPTDRQSPAPSPHQDPTANASLPSPSPDTTSKSKRRSKSKPNATNALLASYKFLGLRISPSPTAYSSPRQRWNSSGAKDWFERQDDPYGGLM